MQWHHRGNNAGLMERQYDVGVYSYTGNILQKTSTATMMINFNINKLTTTYSCVSVDEP